ncbi:MAG: tetratricopeptide repeat protein [Planctomycetes bacterium]|nr:tetratricopeptide repeat protein [Planctomycetota bacterium]
MRIVIVFAVPAAVCLVALLWLHSRTRYLAEARIPSLPDLTGKPESLRTAIEKADRQARLDPFSDERVGRLGLLYHANHFYEPADRCYKLAGELNPHARDWPYDLACLRQTSGISKGVESLLRKVLELAPDDGPARLRLADTLWKQNDLDGALHEYEECLKLQPDNAYALFGLARVAQSQNEWESAQSYLRQTLAVDRMFGPAHHLFAAIHDKLGQAEQANASRARAGACPRYQAAPEPLLDKLDDLCYDPIYLLVRADMARQTFNTPRGLALLRRAVEVAPDNAAAHAGLGAALRELNEPVSARHHLARAIELDPGNLDAGIGMGLLLGSLGDLPGAERFLAEGLKYNPDETSLLYGVGKIARARGDDARATVYFRKAAEHSDLRFDDAIEGHVSCLMRTGKPDEAVSFLERTLALRPSASRPRILLARVWLNQGEKARAITSLRTGLGSAPYQAELADALAGLLVADPDAQPETIREGVELAARAVDFATSAHLPQYLDTLATAYARAGDFGKAVSTQEEAVHRAQERNDAQLEAFRQHLAAFQSGRPVLQPSRQESATTTTRASTSR